MSLDNLALIAAREARGEVFEHPLREEAKGMLCEAIWRMVYKLSISYTASCNECADDLAQDCMKRICDRIGDFNPSLAKFTTWAYRVCQSVLNRAYRRESTRNHRIVSVDMTALMGKYEPREDFDSASMLRSDILTTIRELSERYPKYRSVIAEMFGGSLETGFLSSKVLAAKAAKKTGMTYHEVSEFFKNVVRPHFERRFACVA